MKHLCKCGATLKNTCKSRLIPSSAICVTKVFWIYYCKKCNDYIEIEYYGNTKTK